LADDPVEELFAAVAVEEAAVGGFCAFELGALIRNLGCGCAVRWRGVGAKCEVRGLRGRRRVLVTSLISDRRAVQGAAY
jgi:hypothetical protein